MCLLILKSKSGRVPEQHIRTGFIHNSNGAGIAWSDGSQVHIEKGFFKVKKLLKAMQKLDGKTAIIHMRIATMGSICPANCHPFDAGGGWALGHNGCISNTKPVDDESDTRAFIREHLMPMLEHDDRALIDNPSARSMIENRIGYSKMVLINGIGDKVILNEGMGHWLDGVWYSNYTYTSYSERFHDSYPKRQIGFRQHYPPSSSSEARWGPVDFTPPKEEKWDEESKRTLTTAYKLAVKKREKSIENVKKGSQCFIPVEQSGTCDTCGGPFKDNTAVFWDNQNLILCKHCEGLAKLEFIKENDSVIEKAVNDFLKEEAPQMKSAQESKEELRVIGAT